MRTEPDRRTDAAAHAAVGAALIVHRELGPGLLESVYETCLARELERSGTPFRRQLILPVRYRGEQLDAELRIDLLVDERVVVEVKAVDRLAPIHEAQLMTYLKLADLRVGLLMNFNSVLLKDGLKRIVRS